VTILHDSISTENIGYYRIVNPNARSQRHILILKDSYQNPTIDYFTELFSEVTVIDPREYSEYYSLADLLDISSIDIVLLMYHQNNISDELIDFLE
jgi:transposase-like protein